MLLHHFDIQKNTIIDSFHYHHGEDDIVYQGWESVQHSQVSILRGREGKRGEVIIRHRHRHRHFSERGGTN